MSLTHEIGEHALQFKPLLARLYAERKYTPLWKDNAAARQLLQVMLRWWLAVFLNVQQNP